MSLASVLSVSAAPSEDSVPPTEGASGIEDDNRTLKELLEALKTEGKWYCFGSSCQFLGLDFCTRGRLQFGPQGGTQSLLVPTSGRLR